jgi:hypothetical protein
MTGSRSENAAFDDMDHQMAALTLGWSPEQYFRLARQVPIPVKVCPQMLTATLCLLRALTVSGFLSAQRCSL